MGVSLFAAAQAALVRPTARWACARELRGATQPSPDRRAVIRASLAWIARAQDRSQSADGGVARDFSLVRGWATSYPETTGYIVPTLLTARHFAPELDLADRARRMLDWLVRIQLPCGGFQGGRIDATPIVPVSFNTGQIVLGLAAGFSEFGTPYRDSLRRAADWLTQTQDSDGAWRRFPTPFAAPGEKAYETHVAWGLLEAERVMAGRGYGEAALGNVAWALGRQRANGWMADCCLSDPAHPLTHTLGYALRGIIEAYRFSGDEKFLASSRRLADALLSRLGADGALAGRFDAAWRPAARWSCLTGSVQVAACWALLGQATGEAKYREGAVRANAFVARRVALDGPEPLRGALAGSAPIWGDYCRFEYPNWASKFLIDSLIMEDPEADATPPAAHTDRRSGR